MNAEVLMIKGLISEQSEEDQAAIKQAYTLLKATVEAAEETRPGAGMLALALLGTEKSQ